MIIYTDQGSPASLRDLVGSHFGPTARPLVTEVTTGRRPHYLNTSESARNRPSDPRDDYGGLYEQAARRAMREPAVRWAQALDDARLLGPDTDRVEDMLDWWLNRNPPELTPEDLPPPPEPREPGWEPGPGPGADDYYDDWESFQPGSDMREMSGLHSLAQNMQTRDWMDVLDLSPQPGELGKVMRGKSGGWGWQNPPEGPDERLGRHIWEHTPDYVPDTSPSMNYGAYDPQREAVRREIAIGLGMRPQDIPDDMIDRVIQGRAEPEQGFWERNLPNADFSGGFMQDLNNFNPVHMILGDAGPVQIDQPSPMQTAGGGAVMTSLLDLLPYAFALGV